MTQPTLKPCLHCNGSAEWSKRRCSQPVTIFEYWIVCSNCGNRTAEHRSLDAAVAAWNRRPKQTLAERSHAAYVVRVRRAETAHFLSTRDNVELGKFRNLLSLEVNNIVGGDKILQQYKRRLRKQIAKELAAEVKT